MTVMCLSTTSDQSAERTAATFSLSSAVVLELRRNERKRNGSICRFRKPWQKRSAVAVGQVLTAIREHLEVA